MTFTQLWTQTPLLYSTHISSRLGISAYLKLEVVYESLFQTDRPELLRRHQNVHLSHSFKYRGISLFIQRCIETHGPEVHVVAASGGNAGLAVACAAKVLQVKCTIFIPKGISARTLAFLKSEGAEVIIEGDCYLHALQKAEEAVSIGEHTYV
jgi:L-serine/L-threonine ammonia-lyase